MVRDFERFETHDIFRTVTSERFEVVRIREVMTFLLIVRGVAGVDSSTHSLYRHSVGTYKSSSIQGEFHPGDVAS